MKGSFKSLNIYISLITEKSDLHFLCPCRGYFKSKNRSKQMVFPSFWGLRGLSFSECKLFLILRDYHYSYLEWANLIIWPTLPCFGILVVKYRIYTLLSDWGPRHTEAGFNIRFFFFFSQNKYSYWCNVCFSPPYFFKLLERKEKTIYNLTLF